MVFTSFSDFDRTSQVLRMDHPCHRLVLLKTTLLGGPLVCFQFFQRRPEDVSQPENYIDSQPRIDPGTKRINFRCSRSRCTCAAARAAAADGSCTEHGGQQLDPVVAGRWCRPSGWTCCWNLTTPTGPRRAAAPLCRAGCADTPTARTNPSDRSCQTQAGGDGSPVGSRCSAGCDIRRDIRRDRFAVPRGSHRKWQRGVVAGGRGGGRWPRASG